MKKSFISTALTFTFLLCAVAASAQGVYIYKNGKKQVFKSEEVDSLVFFSTADNTTPSVTEENLNFLQPISQKLLQNLKQPKRQKALQLHNLIAENLY